MGKRVDVRGRKTAKKVASKTAGPKTRAASPDKPKRTMTPSPCLAAHVDSLPEPPELTAQERMLAALDEPTKIPESVWTKFLDDLAETGHIGKSCKRIGIKRVTVFKRRARDQEFSDRFEEAHAMGLKMLEDHAVQRATEGVQKEIYFQGDVVGYATEYSDQLLMFLLQGRDPRYKRKQELTGADGTPLAMLMKLSDAELDAEIAKRMKDLDATP